MGMVTVFVEIGKAADEAPAHGCGGSLVSNGVSGRPHVANRRVERWRPASQESWFAASRLISARASEHPVTSSDIVFDPNCYKYRDHTQYKFVYNLSSCINPIHNQLTIDHTIHFETINRFMANAFQNTLIF